MVGIRATLKRVKRERGFLIVERDSLRRQVAKLKTELAASHEFSSEMIQENLDDLVKRFEEKKK